MAFSSILVDAGIQVLSGLGKSGINKFLSILKDFPSDPEDGILRAKGAKTSTESMIKKLEDDLNEIINILTRNAQMDQLRKIGYQLKKLTALRGVIESRSGGMSMDNALKSQDMLKAYTSIFLALIYDGMVIESVVEQIMARIYEDDYELDDLNKNLRLGIRNLEITWGHYSQVTSDPAIAKAIHQKMKENRTQLISFMDQMDNINANEMDTLVSGVVLKKPKTFGKKNFIESLAVLIYKYGKELETPKCSLLEISQKITNTHPNVQYSNDDMEKAVESLIESNRAYAITVENNLKMVEFKRSNESLVCTNCNNSGGIYREYRHCLVEDKLVCEDCVSFWGKCKICNMRVKDGQHPNV